MSLNTTPDPQVHTSPTGERLAPEHEAEIRASVNAATEGPWTGIQIDAEIASITAGGATLRDSVRVGWTRGMSPADLELVSHAPQYVRSLLAEVDRLRGELAEALRDKDWLDRHYARQIEESVQLRRELDQAQQQFNELSREASAVGRERDELKNQLHHAAMTKVWTNEDGKRFVFVEDIAPHLLDTTTKTEGGGQGV